MPVLPISVLGLLTSFLPAGSGGSTTLISADTLYHITRPAMGTIAEIYLYAANDKRASELFEEAFAEIERVEGALSTYRLTSEVSRINREAGKGPVTTDPEVFALLKTALLYSERTAGAFDVTVGALVKAWESFRESGRFPSQTELSGAMARTGWEKVAMDEESRTVRFLHPGLELDLGGIGKGWVLDRAAAILRRYGVEAALLGLGQSSYVAIGAPPGTSGWPITVPHPMAPEEALSEVPLRDRSLSTSGSTSQYFELNGRRYSHLLDPRTGRPAEGMIQVTVLAATATESDAVATALFVSGGKRTEDLLQEMQGLQALLVRNESSDGQVTAFEWPRPVHGRVGPATGTGR
jgi:thiamine biosynthesis lipoprotein